MVRAKSFPVPAGITPNIIPLFFIPFKISNRVPSPPTDIICVYFSLIADVAIFLPWPSPCVIAISKSISSLKKFSILGINSRAFPLPAIGLMMNRYFFILSPIYCSYYSISLEIFLIASMALSISSFVLKYPILKRRVPCSMVPKVLWAKGAQCRPALTAISKAWSSI